MAGQKLDNLKIAEVASLTNEQVEDFKEKVEEKDPTVNDIEQLIEAEKAGKDRDELLGYLNGLIDKKNISDKLEEALESLDGLEETIDDVDSLEDTDNLEEKDEVELDQSQIIELVEGTVKELKEYVNDNFLYRRQLQEILDAEKAGKNRKTAKRFLEKEIENKGIEEEIKESKRDLSRLRKDVRNLEEHFKDYAEEYDFSDDNERTEESQKAANELLEITNSIIKDLKESDDITNKKALEEKTNQVILALQNDDYNKVKDKLIEISELGREDEEDQDEEAKEKIEEQDEKLERMKEIVQDIENSEDDLKNQDKEEDRELEKKKSIASSLNDDYTEDELREISIGELQDLKKEQEHRDDLISKLKQRGLDEGNLRQSTTSDLEKLLQSSQNMNEKTSRFEEMNEESSKSSEELKEEAEEDLKQLQGAVSQKDLQKTQFEEDNSSSAAEKIEKFKEEIKGKFEKENSSSHTGMEEGEVRNILEKYRDMEEGEGSVKIAHVMKSYLESKLDVQREMTYRELAERIPSDQNDEMRRLSEFFEDMHKQEYTDSVQIENLDDVVDNCEAVLKRMA